MRLDAFYRAWVRIEAYCKGHGGTLFDVLATLKKENLKVANLIDLTVCRFQAQESYESALAYEGHIDAVRFYYPKF
jgi:phosphopantetheinyl transferase